MKILALLILSASAFASQTTLTGTIKDAQGSGVNGLLIMSLPVPAQDTTTNVAVAASPVLFRLVNGAVSGGAQLYDVSTLQPQGLYYAARAYDTAGNLIFNANYVVTGTTFNIGAATPTSITTSNISYAGVTFLGITNVGNFVLNGTYTESNSGIFTNTQTNEYLQSLLNGCTASEYNTVQVGNFTTDAIAGCVAMPQTATVHQVNGIAGYVTNSVNISQSGGAVGGYFQGRQLANNGSSWGINGLVQDVGGLTGHQLISNEVDINIMGTPARAWGLLVSGASTGTIPALGSAAGVEIRSPGYVGGSILHWPAALNIPDGSGTLGINLGATAATGNSVSSQPIQFQGRDGGGVTRNAQISGTSTGTLSLSAVQKLNIQDKGQCTMAAGACSAQTLNNTYSVAPICLATWTGTGALAGAIKIASSTTTVTPTSSNGADTAQVNWICVGN